MDAILIGTGSELSICLDAADALEADGVATRVVSMPCYDRFLEQDEAYRDTVLPPACRARVSVEAAATFGWERFTTADGEAVGMTGFGASGPQPALYEHFGFTPEHVAERARAAVKRLAATT
jgi:transketolase